ncbi:MAG: radical SAM protein, partial [Oscillospiraceae bacterium]
MVLIINGHKFHYEMENLCRIYFPNEHIKILYDMEITSNENIVVYTSVETTSDNETVVFVNVKINNITDDKSEILLNVENVDLELKMAVMLFDLLSKLTDYRPQWGVLTGVRPSKLMTKLISEMGEEKAKSYFKNSLLVTPKKTELAIRVSKKEHEIICQSKPDSFSLYVSIPFCPTRCSYCSFVSHSITSPAAKKLLPEYLDLLGNEIENTAVIARNIGLKLESIYIGGGTPSILNPEQIERLLCQICNNFDISNIKEFTFEAGRPDTIDRAKLDIIKKFPVSRISINPQTFNDEVLQEIGRKHTSKQTLEVFKLANDIGFKDINMDIIAGLPKDD